MLICLVAGNLVACNEPAKTESTPTSTTPTTTVQQDVKDAISFEDGSADTWEDLFKTPMSIKNESDKEHVEVIDTTIEAEHKTYHFVNILYLHPNESKQFGLIIPMDANEDVFGKLEGKVDSIKTEHHPYTTNWNEGLLTDFNDETLKNTIKVDEDKATVDVTFVNYTDQNVYTDYEVLFNIDDKEDTFDDSTMRINPKEDSVGRVFELTPLYIQNPKDANKVKAGFSRIQYITIEDSAE